MADHRPTLIKPPPLDPKKAQIENALELTDLAIIGPVRRARLVGARRDEG